MTPKQVNKAKFWREPPGGQSMHQTKLFFLLSIETGEGKTGENLPRR